MSYFNNQVRLYLTSSSSGTTYTTTAASKWVRVDNSFIENSWLEPIYYTLSDNGGFATTGATITVNVQTQAANTSGAYGRFGINLWGETTIIYVNEYV